jgi:hypothetical protein
VRGRSTAIPSGPAISDAVVSEAGILRRRRSSGSAKEDTTAAPATTRTAVRSFGEGWRRLRGKEARV